MLKNPELYLRKGADRRLRNGHSWIYSNEIDSARSSLKQFSAGDLVAVCGAGGEALGMAYVEPEALICARLMSRQAGGELDSEFFQQRINTALALRDSLYSEPFYRLLYGDSDGISGVVLDRFGDYLVLQLNTAGIEVHQEALVSALVEQLKPKGILLRSDSRSRREAGLSTDVSPIYGEVPEQVELIENGVRFLAPVIKGQKTGWFYDHRENRAMLRDKVVGKRVLDVYSYIGGWGVQAAVFGASEVICLDSSEEALAQVEINAALNHCEERVSTLKGQASAEMERLAAAGERFDVVILDPPAFIQRKRDLGKGRKAYRRINEQAMKLLNDGGLLVSGSCSMHLAEADLVHAIQGAALRNFREARLIARGHQGSDHPIHPAIPETEYLKALYTVVLPPLSAG